LLSISALCFGAARAEETQYAKIGGWTIFYKQLDNMNGCSAFTDYTDQTTVELALLQSSGGKGWAIFISNPQWDSWVRKGSQHRLWLVTKKQWRGIFNVAPDNRTLYFGDASIDFVNSIADAHSLMVYDDSKRPLLSGRLDLKDSEDAIKAVVHCVRDHPLKGPPSPETNTGVATSGTAFFVAPNLLLTNNHVVKDCSQSVQVRYPDQVSYQATISGQDQTNDLALLHTEMPSHSIATFHLQPRLGESVAAYGFPYAGILSSGGNFTLGNVTSLSGIRDDTRFLQISAPIQPGNSGGPLLDMSGSVVGVVVAQLNALAVMQADNSVPQNINFAIQVPIVINFLSVKGVSPKLDTSNAGRALAPADIADLAKKYTVQVYCEAGPQRTSETTTTPNTSTAMEQEAKQFVLSLEAKWSRPNSEALAGLEQMYEDEVMYFGKVTKRSDVIKDKQAFAQKFSERRYKPREPLSVSCRDSICTVSGLLDFRSVDPVAKVISKGVASFDYQLVLHSGAFRINLENGEVLKRDVTPLASVSSRITSPALELLAR